MCMRKQIASEYSKFFSGSEILSNKDERARKAKKIKAIFEKENLTPISDGKLLDIGCSFGIIMSTFSNQVGMCVGVDLDFNAVKSASRAKDSVVVISDGEKLPFESNYFDLVICNHIYEHTDNPEILFKEIKRVLSLGGVCYFAGPNKYSIIEPHWGLPFLSWLPSGLANMYMKIMGKGLIYYEKPYSEKNIKRLLSDFEITDYTEKVIKHPEQYSATDMITSTSIKRLVALIVLKYLRFIFPSFIYLLKKV